MRTQAIIVSVIALGLLAAILYEGTKKSTNE